MTQQTPSPIPGPKPGPSRRPLRAPVPVAAPPSNDPSKYGRIAEDGTVYVTTKDGERVIGSWQAGSAEEGLAHFGARFDDLATEVELLEARVTAHPDEARKIIRQAEELQQSLPTAAVIGDLDGLHDRLAAVIEHSQRAGEQAAQEREERRAAAIARKEELAAEAEAIAAESTNWKAAGDRIHEILDEWRSIRGIDRKTDDALWKRYSRARDSFHRRRGSHFADLDRQRAAARRKKEGIVERAEALAGSRDWRETAQAFRALMDEWKAAGRAQREQDDRLWARFRAAQDQFFGARDAENAARDEEYESNAAAKDALIAEYDALIDPAKNLDGAKAKLRELEDKWDEIGFVPRGRVREFEDKLEALERRVSEEEDARWRRSDPEAQARAAQFQAKVDDLNAQAEKAAAAGQEAKAAELRAQAQQWAEFADAARHAVNS